MDSAGAKSVVSDDMQNLAQGEENISNAVSGHKANLSNPNTSAASKKKSEQAIADLGGESAHYGDEENPASETAKENLS